MLDGLYVATLIQPGDTLLPKRISGETPPWDSDALIEPSLAYDMYQKRAPSMNTSKTDDLSLSALLNQLQRYAPHIPAILAVQLLSSLLENRSFVKSNPLLRILLEKRFSLATTLALAGVSLQDLRKSTTEEFGEELKNYASIEKARRPEEPFKIEFIGGNTKEFLHLDQLADFIGSYSIEAETDRAFRSFDAARRCVILGWVDPYLLRTGEFLATRSLEQSMHVLFSEATPDKDRVAALTKTRDSCVNKDGTPTPAGKAFVDFVLPRLPEITNLYEFFDNVIKKRDDFVHRCSGESSVFELDFSAFQLAQVCLKYRKQLPA